MATSPSPTARSNSRRSSRACSSRTRRRSTAACDPSPANKSLPARTNSGTPRAARGSKCQRMTVVYNLTAPGNDALFAKNGQADFPLEYRRLLGLISSCGHIDVLRGRLRRFTDQLIDEWLKELLDLQMVEASAAGNLDDFTFT